MKIQIIVRSTKYKTFEVQIIGSMMHLAIYHVKQYNAMHSAAFSNMVRSMTNSAQCMKNELNVDVVIFELLGIPLIRFLLTFDTIVDHFYHVLMLWCFVWYRPFTRRQRYRTGWRGDMLPDRFGECYNGSAIFLPCFSYTV